jgi:hypothetical protein
MTEHLVSCVFASQSAIRPASSLRRSCAGCGALLRPKPGDCCVFCSYGSVPCPPIQANPSCCATQDNR